MPRYCSIVYGIEHWNTGNHWEIVIGYLGIEKDISTLINSMPIMKMQNQLLFVPSHTVNHRACA
jgi:hypothetical protein